MKHTGRITITAVFLFSCFGCVADPTPIGKGDHVDVIEDPEPPGEEEPPPPPPPPMEPPEEEVERFPDEDEDPEFPAPGEVPDPALWYHDRYDGPMTNGLDPKQAGCHIQFTDPMCSPGNEVQAFGDFCELDAQGNHVIGEYFDRACHPGAPLQRIPCAAALGQCPVGTTPTCVPVVLRHPAGPAFGCNSAQCECR